VPIWDIFYFQNTPKVTFVQHICPFSLTVSLTIFLYRALEAACAAYASLNLSLLHYIPSVCLHFCSIYPLLSVLLPTGKQMCSHLAIFPYISWIAEIIQLSMLVIYNKLTKL